jgi:hypothetical protein
MLRRVLWCAVAALALYLTAVTERATASNPKTAASPASTRYSVYTRKPGAAAWNEHGCYSTGREAAAAARQLHDRGLEVQVHSWITMAHLPNRPRTPSLPASDTVTLKQAAQVFRWLAGQKDIAFRYPTDGCYARAHLMIRRMQKRGLKPWKVWAFANGGESLYVRTTNHPSGHVKWRYHLAPLLRVRDEDGQQRWYVIDPALFRAPASIREWRDTQKKPGSPYTPYVTVTRVGQAPKDAHGMRLPGSGYWPGPDPREGSDAHAVKTMRRYKPFEGRWPPRTLAAGIIGREELSASWCPEESEMGISYPNRSTRWVGMVLSTGPARGWVAGAGESGRRPAETRPHTLV